jgi:hypothetical protein
MPGSSSPSTGASCAIAGTAEKAIIAELLSKAVRMNLLESAPFAEFFTIFTPEFLIRYAGR